MGLADRRQMMEKILQVTAERGAAGWCPSCGVSRYNREHFDQTAAENRELRSRNTVLEQRIALLMTTQDDQTSQLLAEEITELRAEMATQNLYWLRNKVTRQAAVIRRLEDKLRRKGVEPYEDGKA